MKIYNKSKDTEIYDNFKEVSTFSDKLFGLLKISNPRGLIFRTRFGIHTFFLKSPIDVIVLDKDFKVVKFATVKPNKLFFWNPKYTQVVELPEGSIQSTKTSIGDLIKLM